MASKRITSVLLPSAWKTDDNCERWRKGYAHEAVAARALSVFFPTQVVAPVQRHVSAKRLLCSLDETYYAGLSDASKRSFAVQGGELSRSEAMRLLALEGMEDAMALRRWDDRAKVHGVEVPDLDAYGQVVLDHLL